MILTIDRSYPHCTVLILNRPNKRNALTIDLMNALSAAIEETQSLSEQRAIILKGAETVFCAGLDLSEAVDLSLEEPSSLGLGKLLKTIYECPLVTIAAVHGAALGGGAGIVCACDLAIAEPNTLFGFPETRRGLVPAQIMPFVIRMLPRRLLHELILLGDSIDSRRAYEIGLINKVTQPSSCLQEALKYVESLVKGAPRAASRVKKFIRQIDSVNMNESLKLGLALHREVRHCDESKEGMQAFLEKRAPSWSV